MKATITKSTCQKLYYASVKISPKETIETDDGAETPMQALRFLVEDLEEMILGGARAQKVLYLLDIEKSLSAYQEDGK